MTQIVNQLLDAAQKRIAYARTVAEIEAMSLDVALDLGIFREDAPKIAQCRCLRQRSQCQRFPLSLSGCARQEFF